MIRKRTLGLVTVGIAGAALAVSTLYQRAATETVPHTVVARVNGVELRRYPETVAVETTADSQRVAFQRLFRYIAGGNSGGTEIEMTAPVELSGGGATIAMTAPVEVGGTETQRMRFYLPPDFDRENPPQPIDDAVELTIIPERTLAVRRFTWRPTDARIDRESQALQETLADANVSLTGEPFFMGYDAPWTLPFLRRNEVAVEVES